MCGIFGTFGFSKPLVNEKILERMTSALAHRGPDDTGIWKDESLGICLAHRRLSILDLSPHGSQPMCSNDGRFIIAFNGVHQSFGGFGKAP